MEWPYENFHYHAIFTQKLPFVCTTNDSLSDSLLALCTIISFAKDMYFKHKIQ